MQVHLINPDEIVDTSRVEGFPFRAFNQILEDSRLDKWHRHALCGSAHEADIVLAPVNDGLYGPFFEKLRAWRPLHAHRSRLLVYSPDDNQHPALPGLYPSCSSTWRRLKQAMPAHYRSEHFPKFNYSDSELAAKDLLCSFVGSVRSHPIRAEIMKLKCPNSLLHDASGSAWWWSRSVEEQEPFTRFYRQVAARSRFILCPRGVSTASIRIYEAMEASAVPVIIADGIVLPEGPDWSAFAIRVPNARIREIPDIVAHHDGRALEMGALARESWRKFFSPQSSFNSLIDWGHRLLEERRQMSLGTAGLLAAITPICALRNLRRKVAFWQNEMRSPPAVPLRGQARNNG
jgi:hypothetical protein